MVAELGRAAAHTNAFCWYAHPGTSGPGDVLLALCLDAEGIAAASGSSLPRISRTTTVTPQVSGTRERRLQDFNPVSTSCIPFCGNVARNGLASVPGESLMRTSGVRAWFLKAQLIKPK